MVHCLVGPDRLKAGSNVMVRPRIRTGQKHWRCFGTMSTAAFAIEYFERAIEVLAVAELAEEVGEFRV